MTQPDAELLEIYVGVPVAHRSEERLLHALADFAKATATPVIALANFELGGRQFDFVVITQNQVVVVDAKSSVFPVRGKINGTWEHLLPGRNWLPMTNGYLQVVELRNLLRNSMAGVAHSFYPEGAVVFSDDLPRGSDLTKGNFKAWVYQDLQSFLASLRSTKSNPWSFEDWRTWALAQGLSSMSMPEAIDNEPSGFLRRYRQAFVTEYEPQASSWIPESDEHLGAIGRELAQSPGVFVTGPSGCGKTLMMKAAAVSLARSGAPIIFLQGKDITLNLPEALRTEIGLVGDVSFKDFRNAIRATSGPLCIFLDGINEVPATALTRTLRGLATLARRLGARVVVSGQQSCPEQLSVLKTFHVFQPTMELKQKIAIASSGSLSAAATQLLTSVKSGFEAAMTGELQHELGPAATRSHLVEQYIRKRLPRNSRTLAAALGALASDMFGQLAFSVTEPAFDDFMLARGLNDEDFETLLGSGLVERRTGRISFSHEMLFYGSAARAYSREARRNAISVASILNSVIGGPLALDVIAGVDDEDIVLTILENIRSPQLIAEAAAGEAGKIARAAADKMLQSARGAMSAEIATLSLSINNKSIEWTKEPEHSPAERARFSALGLLFLKGMFVGQFLHLCREMDARLRAESARLWSEPQKPKISVRSLGFALAYLGHYGGHSVGFTLMLKASQPLFDRETKSEALKFRTLQEMTSGEIYVVTEHAWMFYAEDNDRYCEQLAEVVESRLVSEPYHVQLSLLHHAGFVRGASDAAIGRLISAIGALDTDSLGIAIGGSVIDALKHLGALDDDAEEARASIRAQVALAVSAADDDDARGTALGIYTCQFDHPFDHIYYEEVAALPPEQKQTLLVRAFSAERLPQSFSLMFVAREVSEQNNPAHVQLFSRFAVCPQDNPMWQDEIGSFVLATRFLVRHGAELPEAPASNDNEKCFLYLRDIVAAAESGTAEGTVRAGAAWNNLLTLSLPVVMANLRDIMQEGLSDRRYDHASKAFPPIDLARLFPENLLALARTFVQNREPARSSKGFPEQQATDFAFQILGKYGDRGDLGSLRAAIAVPEFSRSAIAAISEIEKRD